MEKTFEAIEFLRQLYLKAEPSIDIFTSPGPIKPSDHRIKISDLKRIEDEFGVRKGTDLAVSVAMFILDRGPQLVEG